MKPEELTIAHVEQAAGIPTEKWEGNCYGIACAVADKLATGVAVYGHYTGDIDVDGYWGHAVTHPFVQHGWVLLSDGRILDPTRWSFENREPYLALFSEDDPEFEDYDEGGNSWRSAMRSPCPTSTDKPKVKLDVRPETRQFIEHQLPEGVGFDDITMDQVFWLANFPYGELGNLAGDLYLAISKLEFGRGFIPLDNQRRAQREFGVDLG